MAVAKDGEPGLSSGSSWPFSAQGLGDLRGGPAPALVLLP